MAVTENALLDAIYQRSKHDMPTSVIVGPGDDMAVIESNDQQLLIGVDQVVEHLHFDLEQVHVDQVAYKALARSVSDVAAMAGTPMCAVVSAMLPSQAAYNDELAAAIHRHGLALGCPVVGGDISIWDGPLQLAATVTARPHAIGPVLRTGAKPGHSIYVTGAIGNSYASGWHAEFIPRVAVAQLLADELGTKLAAMIDLSDGLAMDLTRLIQSSKANGTAGAIIQVNSLPSRGGCNWRAAVGDGEDYELLFTTPREADVPSVVDGVPVTCVGEITDAPGVFIKLPDGSQADLQGLGWEHGR